MLTLPAEITNNKNKIAVKPILLIEFTDLNYHISSRVYDLEVGNGSDGSGIGGSGKDFSAASATFQTWNMKGSDKITINGTNYTVDSITDETHLITNKSEIPDIGSLDWIAYNSYISEVDKGHSGGLTQSLPMFGGGLGSISDYSVRLLEWESVLRSNIIGSTPDLRGSNVKVYVKLDIAGSQKDEDALLLFKGQIADYNISKDKMVLKFKAIQPVLTDLIPTSLLRDSYPGRGDDTFAVPIQFGDFNRNRLYWKNTSKIYAICPYIGKTDDNYYKFVVSDHIMNEMPTGADLITGTSGTDATGHDPSICGFINNHFFKLTPTAIDSIVNTSDGAYFIVEDFDETDMMFYFTPTEAHDDNTDPDWANTIDGDSTTYGMADNFTTKIIRVTKPYTDPIQYGPPSSTEAANDEKMRLVISIGSVVKLSRSDHIYADIIGDGFIIGNYYARIEIGTGNANSIMISSHVTTPQENLGVVIHVVGTNDAASVQIKSILMMTQVPASALMDSDFDANYLESNPYVFIKAKGKEYSGDWDTRKTAGNLIENPADMIESLLRDEVGSINTDIDMDSFDDINNIMGSINVRTSLYQRSQAKNLLDDTCKAFSMSLNWNAAKQWRLTMPVASGNNFASSDTGTPNAEDIFTDGDILSGDVYTNHPIVKGSMRLDRSPENSAYDKLTLLYADVLGIFLDSASAGSGKNKSIKNKYISDSASATALIGILDNIYLNQHWLAKFNTWYNALAHEVGDVINIRHSSINDDMLDATENAQKWIVHKIKQGWHPAWATIYAMELF